MNPTLKAHIIRYLAAMNATAFDSAVHSVAGFGGAAGIHEAAQELGAAVPTVSLAQMGMFFLSAFGWAIVRYLDAHPVSEFVDDRQPLAAGAAPVLPKSGN